MTRPDPAPLAEAADWCAGLAAVLADVAGQAGGLAARIADDWSDDHGREWAERAALLRRELSRDALAATELATDLARRSADASLTGAPTTDSPTTGAGALSAPVAGSTRPTGARLGGTDADRVDEERGMRIAQLADDPG